MIALTLSATALAGAWTKDVGDLYLKGGADLYSAQTFQAPGAIEQSEGTYFGQQYGLYVEAGVLPIYPLQLSVGAPATVGIHNTQIFDAFGELPVRAVTVRGGDMRVSLQTALARDKPLAVALEVKVPLYRNGGVGQSVPNFVELFPKPGDGQLDYTLWLYGGAAPLPNLFAEGGLGYIHRTESFVGWDTEVVFNDGPRGLAKVGYRLGPVLPIVGIEGQFAFKGTTADGEEDPYTRQFVIASANALIDLAGGLAVEPRVAVDLWARNAPKGVGYGLGLSYRR